MSLTPLTALSPVDGRYAARCADLREIFSEQGLIRARVRVEIAWLHALAGERRITELRGVTPADLAVAQQIIDGFDPADAATVKARAAAEAEAMLADANAQVDRLVAADNIPEIAQQRARDLVMQAKREASGLRQGAESYVANSLEQTSNLLSDLLRRTEAGIRALSDRGEVDEAANINLD